MRASGQFAALVAGVCAILLVVSPAMVNSLPTFESEEANNDSQFFSFAIVEQLDTPEASREFVKNNNVHAVWRKSALARVSPFSPALILPKGAKIVATGNVTAGEFPLIVLDDCSKFCSTASSASSECRILHSQQDGTCIVASKVSFEALDEETSRENILPVVGTNSHSHSHHHHHDVDRLLPQPAAPDFVKNLKNKEKSSDDKQEEVIRELLKKVSIESQRAHLDYLTNKFNSRLSSTNGVRDAANWLKQQFEQVGLASRLFEYSETYGPVVEAILPGTTHQNKIVVVGAHLDDRSKNITDPLVRAPGANDDGSGIAMLLELALVVAKSGVQFEHAIHFMAFTGEEQGLYGSKAYAQELSDRGVEVVAMIQGDMIGQLPVGLTPRMSIATQYSTDWMADYVKEIAEQYVPSLTLSITDSCCTDQYSFFTRGYPAIAVNEGGGYLIDPMYHNTGDVVDRADYSVEQISQISRVILAGAMTAAKVVVA